MGNFHRHSAGLIDNAFDEMSGWSCFGSEEEDDEAPIFPEEGVVSTSEEPFFRKDPKIGRNAPCPCGSGKKYKEYCGR